MNALKFTIILSLAFVIGSPFSHAKVITVTTTENNTFNGNSTGHKIYSKNLNNGSNGIVSLQEALDKAKNGDTINFSLPKDTNRTIVFTYEFPAITHNITVDGGSTSNLTIEVAKPGESVFRLFQVGLKGHPANVVFKNLTLKGGDVTSRSDDSNLGGTLYIKDGGLTLDNVTVDGSKALDGGGIYNSEDGSLTMENSTISDNTAVADTNGGGAGGGICNKGKLTIENSTVADNTGVDGGGIFTDSASEPVMINSSTIALNSVSDNSNSAGISLLAGNLSMDNSLLSDNKAGSKAGSKAVSFVNSGGTVTDLDDNIIQTPFADAWTGANDWLDTDGAGTFKQKGVSGKLFLDSCLKDNGGPNETIAIKNKASIANTLQENSTENNVFPDKPDPSGNFGYSVSVSGDNEIVGDYISNKAYIYHYNDETGWTLARELDGTDQGKDSGAFGNAVSISGNTAIVGDFYSAGASGAAYIFRYDGGEWIREAKLTPPQGNVLSRFGNIVSISGNFAAVATKPDSLYNSEGIVYIYKYDGANWNFEQKLTAQSYPNCYACSLSLSGNRIIIGDTGYGETGKAYIYEYNGTAWIQKQQLASGTSKYDGFGKSVAISNDIAVVGAIGNTARGAVYVYKYDGTSWVKIQKLTSENPKSYEYFGGAVSISGNNILIGASGTESGEKDLAGAAYVFVCNGDACEQSSKLEATNPAKNDLFGCSVSISGKNILVGVPLADPRTHHGFGGGMACNYTIPWNDSCSLDERGIERATESTLKRTIGAYEYKESV